MVAPESCVVFVLYFPPSPRLHIAFHEWLKWRFLQSLHMKERWGTLHSKAQAPRDWAEGCCSVSPREGLPCFGRDRKQILRGPLLPLLSNRVQEPWRTQTSREGSRNSHHLLVCILNQLYRYKLPKKKKQKYIKLIWQEDKNIHVPSSSLSMKRQTYTMSGQPLSKTALPLNAWASSSQVLRSGLRDAQGRMELGKEE